MSPVQPIGTMNGGSDCVDDAIPIYAPLAKSRARATARVGMT
jgi:hypothetical protein